MEVAQRVFQGFAKEYIGHRMVARGHDGEMHLVAWRAQLPVDEGHKTQHDVVVVRTGVINHLVVQDVDTTPELGLHVVDDFLNSFEAQVGDAGATGVVLQVVESQFVGITVEDLAEAEHGMFGLLEGPWAAFKKFWRGFIKHSMFYLYIMFFIKNVENWRIIISGLRLGLLF